MGVIERSGQYPKDKFSIQGFVSKDWVNIIDPKSETIHVEDIAHHLSMICRYIGGTPFHYSVAQHSAIVGRRCAGLTGGSRIAGLCGLLHDASEAYLGDVSWPLKQWQGMGGYLAVERLMENVIAQRFDLPERHNDVVRLADREVLLGETRDFFGDPEWARDRIGNYAAYPPTVIPRISPELAREEFMNEFIFYASPELLQELGMWHGMAKARKESR